MALFSGNIRSHVLDMDTDLTVILPYDRPAEQQQTPCKVAYLLHGLGENSSAWSRYTSVERYAREYGIALVMPAVQRSFYLDMVYGMRYFTYITEELPALCHQLFRLSQRREDTFVAGLSMGGYGAMHCALARPELYGAAASLSGAVDLRGIVELNASEATIGEFTGVLGPEFAIREDMDLYQLADDAAKSSCCPAIYSACGQQDFLYEMNADFSRHMSGLPVTFQFETWDGDHEWGFWDVAIQRALAFFMNRATINV